jgi:hypothetical protein
MILKRFLLIFLVAFAAQAVAFAAYYNDLLFLHRPMSALSAVSADDFARHATRALTRKKLTVAHVETIAQVAQALRRPDVEASALERKLKMDGGQAATRLRLADAWRRAGEPVKAERVYLELLAGTRQEDR